MDRVAGELVASVNRDQRRYAGVIALAPVCPPFARRATRIWPRSPLACNADRALNRWWDYPRHVEAIASEYDLFHIIDHSYAHLVHRLPLSRTVVTCHDLDTFRSVLRPEDEPRSAVFRSATRRILTGLQRATKITCDTAAIRDELLGFGLISPERVSVVPVGVSDAFSADPDDISDREAAHLIGSAPGSVEILHVGSTIARKRIDSLIAICAELRRHEPGLRLVRVGGPFTREQHRLIREHGLDGCISAVDFVGERTLAALYRRAAVLLQPSEREGFGLPLLEAMACGTPVVASALPALKEVGGTVAEYCPVGDIHAWVETATRLLDERRCDRARWLARRQAGRARARCFSWSRFAAQMTAIYQTLAGPSDEAHEPARKTVRESFVSS